MTVKHTSYLFHLLLLLLLLPLLQQSYELFETTALHGYVAEKATVKEWTWENWSDGSFQQAKEKERLQQFGFRNNAIRVSNQVDYSLFRKSNVSNVVVGKNNILFGSDYVRAYTGENFVGQAVVDAKIKRLKRIQDTLQQLNKQLLFVITPNKADYYPEFLPDYALQKGKGATTNYRAYKDALQTHAIQHIDLNSFFYQAKDTLQYPAFPSTGVHLSPYATIVFTDTLIRYLEYHLEQDLPDFSITSMLWSDSATMDERDAENALNLLFDVAERRYMNVAVKFDYKNKYQPNVLATGDSFYWNFLELRSNKYLFHHHRFLYYNKKAFPGGDVKNLNLTKEIERADVILFVNSAFNLWRFGFEFDMDLYLHFFGDEVRTDSVIFDQLVQEKIYFAKENKEWMRYIKSQVKDGKDINQLIYDNVAYLLRKKLDRFNQ